MLDAFQAACLDRAGCEESAQNHHLGREWAKAAGKTFVLQQVYDSTSQYSGIRRILVELADKPDTAQKYCRQYVKLVESIAGALKDSLGADANDNREICNALWNIISSRFVIIKEDADFLSTSLFTNKWDCDNVSDFSYDVINDVIGRLRQKPEFVNSSKHVFLKLGDIDFEPNRGWIYSSDSVSFYHPEIVEVTGDINESKTSAYIELADRDVDAGRFSDAEKKYKKALEVNCENPNAHNCLGALYFKMKRYEDALEEFTIAADICPNGGDWYANRAWLYLELGMPKEANADAETFMGSKGARILLKDGNVIFYITDTSY